MTIFTGDSADNIFTGGSDGDTANGNGGNDTLSGAGGADTLAGGAGQDVLDGGTGDDRLYSGVESPAFNLPYYGNPWTAPVLDIGSEVDTLIGGDGSDRLFAGYGDNVNGGEGGSYGDYLYISFLGGSAGVTVDFRQTTQTVGGGVITGVENISWVQGSNYADNINVGSLGGGYSDFTAVFGMGGDDQLTAGYYTGTLWGGDGADTVDGRNSQYLQSVDGGDGADILYTNSNTFGIAYGGDGDDTIYAHGAVYGGGGADHIVMQVTYYTGRVLGEAGDDVIESSGSANSVSGGAGADILNGGGGADSLTSADFVGTGVTAADDMGLEHDALSGFAGDDTLYIGYGDDADGGTGSGDVLFLSLGGSASGLTFSTAGIVSAQPYSLAGGTISNIEILSSLRGTEFADNLTLVTQATLLTVNAGAGDDVVISQNSSVNVDGGSGDDRFVSGAAGDTWNGGLGTDTIDYSGYTSGVTVNLATSAGAGGDQLLNIENIIGSAFNDSFVGLVGTSVIAGGAGTDRVSYENAGSAVTVSLALTDAQNTGGGGLDTLSGIENLAGSAYDDLLAGDAGANTLDGLAGTDTVTYAAANSAVTVNLAIGSAQATGGAGADTLISIESLIGSDFNDTLAGDGGANRIDGGLGNDSLDGAAGVDTLSYASATVGVSISLAVTAQQNTGGAGLDTIANFENLTGSAFDDSLSGDASANTLDGGAGADTASYAAASSRVEVSLGLSTAQNTLGAGVDTVLNFENLIGSAFDDLLSGSSGTNVLSGGAGSDTVTYIYSAAGVTVDLATTGLQNTLGAGIDTLTGFENLTGSNFNDTLSGDAGANVLDGGAGTDTISYALAASGVTVNLSLTSAQDTRGAGLDTLARFENLTGSAFDDYLSGTSGANQLNGGAGIDTVSYAAATAAVNANLTTFQSSGGGGLDGLTNIENLVGSAFNDFLSGDGAANLLDGGDGNDTLNGAAGDDVIFGGLGANTLAGSTGFDTVSYANATGGVTVALFLLTAQTTGGAGVDTLSGFEKLIGSAFDDQLKGAAGDTTIDGGAGNDTLSYIDAASAITLDLSLTTAQATGASGNDTVLNIENLVGTNFNDVLTGAAGANQLLGGNGADTLNGGAGDDLLYGGAGNDLYVVDSLGDVAFEDLGGGTDGVTASVGYYLHANVENLTLASGAGAIFGVGNELGNVLAGNEADNLLIAGAGTDTLNGGAGNDSLFGEGGNDSLNGDGGIDYIVAGAGDDGANGGDQSDAIYGEDGNDILNGGVGFFTDILVGGDGNDIILGASGLGDYDLMDGGTGNDVYYVDTPDDLTFEAVGGGTDTVQASITGAGYYLYANVENLVLGGNTPFGVGNELANTITGNAIGNFLLGGAGDDVLNGKAGNDVLFGEAGADTFVFEHGTGGDVIGDFQTGLDRINLSAIGFASFAALQASMVQNGNVGAIDLGGGDLLVLHNVTMTALTASDFIL